MLVNDDFTAAIVPLHSSKDFDLNNFYGGIPLSLFQIDLVKASYTIQRMDHFAASYLGPGYVVWRHLIKNEKRGQDYKTSHFSATGVDLIDKDLPLIRLLNRYKDSLPEFHNRFAISSQGWALLGVQSPKSETEVFLLNPENGGQITPVFVSGYALPIESMSRCAISDDGQYFAFVTRFKDSKFSVSGGEVVHLGRVHRSKEGLDIRITRIGEFSDLDLTKPIWIPGTHALTLVTDPLEHPSLIRIYDLDKQPVDWAKVDLATKHDEVK